MIKKAFSISPLKTRFSPLLFSGELNKGLEIASMLGYDGIEISIKNPLEMKKEDLKRKLNDLNLIFFAIGTGQSYYNDGLCFSSENKSNRLHAVRRVKDHIDFARDFNSKIIIGGMLGNIEDKLGDGSANERRIIGCFNDFLDYAENKGVKILFEPINRYETSFINTIDEARKFINIFKSDNLSIIADTFHMNIEESNLEKSLKDNIDIIEYIHLVDSNRKAPGMGHINFRSMINTLKKYDYNGVVSFEVLPLPDDLTAAKWSIEYIERLDSGIDGAN